MNTVPAHYPDRFATAPVPFRRRFFVDVRRPSGVRTPIDIVIPGAIKRDPEAFVGSMRTSSRGVRSSCTACMATKFRRTRPLRFARRDSTPVTWKAALLVARPWRHRRAICEADPLGDARRPKIDRIACPWLSGVFIDPSAESSTCRTRSARLRCRQCGDALRRARRHVRAAARNAVSMRSFASTSWPTRRWSISPDRARRRYQRTWTRAAGAGPARGVARAFRELRRRSCDAALGHARLRRAVRVVPHGERRTATSSCTGTDGDAAPADARRGVRLLAAPRLHLLRRPGGADRADASRARG